MITKDAIRRTLASTLQTRPEEILAIEACNLEGRNLTYRLTLKEPSNPIFLKFQGGPQPSMSVADEADVLEALEDSAGFVPRLLCHGRAVPDGSHFLITEELQGVSLHHVMGTMDGSSRKRIFQDMAFWLRDFQNQTRVHDLCEAKAPRRIGTHAKDFNPTKAAGEFFAVHKENLTDRLNSALQRVLDNAGQEDWAGCTDKIVHGSLTTYNVLVTSPRSAGINRRLAGIIDFEATRLGNIMFDVAGFAFDCLLSPLASSAKEWLETCAAVFGIQRIKVQVPAFLTFFYLTRLNASSSSAKASTPPEEALISLLC